tara:strand:- start:1266 stop:1889 length:624 start_codon:yes stop_codon:yes gene_type:complete
MSDLYIIAAPSGCGKTSLVKALLKTSNSLRVSVSHTTRKPREGEINGENYHFISTVDFQKMISNEEFIEHAEVFENLYGTSKKVISDSLNNTDVILEIDWQGAQQVKHNLQKAISIFILPPSKDALELRLRNRNQDSDATIKKRMLDAKSQMSHYKEFDYLVINDDFDLALADLKLITASSSISNKSSHLLTDQQSDKHKKLLKQLI